VRYRVFVAVHRFHAGRVFAECVADAVTKVLAEVITVYDNRNVPADRWHHRDRAIRTEIGRLAGDGRVSGAQQLDIRNRFEQHEEAVESHAQRLPTVGTVHFLARLSTNTRTRE